MQNVIVPPIRLLDEPLEGILLLAIKGARSLKTKGIPKAEIPRQCMLMTMACLCRLGYERVYLQMAMDEVEQEFNVRFSHLYPPPPPPPRAATYPVYSFQSQVNGAQ